MDHMYSVINRYKTKPLSLPALPLNYITVQCFDEDWQSDLNEHCQQNCSLPFAQSNCHSVPIESSRLLTNFSQDVKPVYEIVFNIKDVKSDFNYNPGDTVGILPINSENEVSLVIKTLALVDICERKMSLKLAAGSKKKFPNYLPEHTSIRRCLRECLDLHTIPKKLFLRSLSEHLTDVNEKRFLEILCSKEGSIEYSETIVHARKGFLEVLKMFQSWRNVPFRLLLEHLHRLLPRPYSIVNCPLKDENCLKIWFSVNEPPGITTKMLKDLAKATDNNGSNDFVSMYLRGSNSFQYTTDEMEDSIILIASGVGVSPFIGFLEHRENIRNLQRGIRLGNAYMLYGSRYEAISLCKNILKHHLSVGSLNDLKEAFSRDAHSKFKYVQDHIKENGASFIDTLMKDNCRIYVCGSENMVQDVRQSIAKCLASINDYSDTDAVEFIQKLLKEKRYIEDTWR